MNINYINNRLVNIGSENFPLLKAITDTTSVSGNALASGNALVSGNACLRLAIEVCSLENRAYYSIKYKK
jgi:hypothetical protein